MNAKISEEQKKTIQFRGGIGQYGQRKGRGGTKGDG